MVMSIARREANADGGSPATPSIPPPSINAYFLCGWT